VTENTLLDPKTAFAVARTSLAKYRTSLALDRTALAWVRTAVTFATFGFGMIGFFRTLEQATRSEKAMQLHRAAIHMGVALVVIGLVATLQNGYAAARQRMNPSSAARTFSRWPTWPTASKW
jgi:putative membrane protein